MDSKIEGMIKTFTKLKGMKVTVEDIESSVDRLDALDNGNAELYARFGYIGGIMHVHKDVLIACLIYQIRNKRSKKDTRAVMIDRARIMYNENIGMVSLETVDDGDTETKPLEPLGDAVAIQILCDHFYYTKKWCDAHPMGCETISG